ncbi:hypothetical protein FMM05_18125 [Flavobacterium zepuense]|uniref:Phage abortive infection protein n=1 Tax=Flavobacterium zepuense TaxID=2593302 RepID=A0A552UW04_9FLAO|nr:hypothetical protein [Flavobacterium zepuense]TRW22421.1 hypothetical protein FMM05_18125 [Flavobacterium zepuense]
MEKHDLDKERYDVKYWPVILISTGIVILLFLWVFLLTRNFSFESFDFTATGQIGDTIGGLTAPIIGLFGAILVYVSFQAQLKANRMQFDALNYERNRVISEMKKQDALRWYQYRFDEQSNLANNFEQLSIFSNGREYKGHAAILILNGIGLKTIDPVELQEKGIYIMQMITFLNRWHRHFSEINRAKKSYKEEVDELMLSSELDYLNTCVIITKIILPNLVIEQKEKIEKIIENTKSIITRIKDINAG